MASPSLPVNSVAELVAHLKKNPGKYTYFSAWLLATPAHLLGEMFKLETGVKVTTCLYVEFPQAIADLVSGFNAYLVHHDAAGGQADQERQAQGACSHGQEAHRGAERCPGPLPRPAIPSS